MKSIFRATAILSSSSLLTILVSLVAAKVMALSLGATGYGYYGLLQSVVAIMSMVSGVGMATGLVRLGAGSISTGERGTVDDLRSGAWLVFGCLGAIALAVAILFRDPLSRLAFGKLDGPWTMPLLGVACLFTVAGTIQTGTLNAFHRVEALATYAVANSVLGGVLAIVAILAWRARGVMPAILGGAILSWLVGVLLVRRQIGRISAPLFHGNSVRAALGLLKFGAPYTLSMLVGSGVQLALPIVVLHLLNTESVGYYKAAAAISVGYLGFLVTAMGQDYYPRVAAARDDPGALVKLINTQFRLVMLLAVPIILGMLAVVPFLVPLVYSRNFTATIAILEWQLIGDLFKFSSWTISFAILARCSSTTYLITETIGGAIILASTWFAVRFLGLAGLGVSFLISYAIYYVVAWVTLRREIPLRIAASNKWMMLSAVGAALVIRLLPSTPLAPFRTPVALLLATATGGLAAFALWQEYISSKDAGSIEVAIVGSEGSFGS